MKKILILVLGLSLSAASCGWLGSTGSKGVLKSEDAAETFEASNKLEKKGEISGVTVNTFTFDQAEPDILYIGSASGIHKSEDGAATWKHLLAGMRIGSIQIDPGRSDIVYATGISSTNGRIIKSIDSGNTWTDIFTEPTKNNAVLSLAISKANSKILLAGLNSGEIIRSVDEGITWQLVKDMASPILKLRYTGNTTAYALTQNAIYVTNDQGSNWSAINVSTEPPVTTNIPGGYTYTVTPRTQANRIMYDMAFDPRLSGVIFLATEQGLLRTIDGGSTWSIMSLPVMNETLKVSSVAINPTNSNNIYIAIGSTIFKTTNGGVTWETRKLPTEQGVRHIVINPDEPNIIYLGMGDR